MASVTSIKSKKSVGSLKLAANQLQVPASNPDSQYWAVVQRALVLAQVQLDTLSGLVQALSSSSSPSVTPVTPGGNTPYVIPNVSNTFTPDFTHGPIQYILLVADSTLETPVNVPLIVTFPWVLIIDQDASGGHNLVTDPSYVFSANLLGTAAVSTRSTSNWQTDQTPTSSLTQVPITDQPIPS